MTRWIRRPVGVLLGMLIVIGASAVLEVAAPSVAGATTVTIPDGNTTTFKNALADPAVTQIDITTTDINCDAGPFATGGTDFTRLNSTPLTINGNGQAITGGNCTGGQVLLYGGSTGELTLTNVKVTGGSYTGTCSIGGAGVQSNSDVLLDHSAVVGNSVTSSGTTGAGCAADGGGIVLPSTGATLTLLASTVANNSATCNMCGAVGGGISAATVNAVRSTITNNTTSSTVSTQGGGIIASAVSLVDSTVVENTATTGANLKFSGTLTTYGSVIALPQTGGNCSGGTTASNGNNWDDSPAITQTCNLNGPHDHDDASPLHLGALANNGGLTQTRLPDLATSPLVDAISNADCTADGAANIVTDQRDLDRPGAALGNCDIGAVEVPFTGAASGTYTALPPNRILDTRNGTGLSGAFAPQQTRDLVVAGGATTVPDNGVTAVVLNVTATGPTAAGWLTLFPTGQSLPTASNLNFVAGQTVPNLVVVKLGTPDINGHGQVSINNTGGNPGAGSVNVVADVVGYYADDNNHVNTHGEFTSITPTRVLDTRSNFGLPGPFTPNQHQTLDVTGGATGVPDTASAVVINVTATGPSAAGWLTISPFGSIFPNAANLNFLGGQTVPNLVVVGTGPNVGGHGAIDIANTDVPGMVRPPSGTVHVVGDIVGYFDTTVSTAVLMPPQRILDTRFGTGGVMGPVGPNAAITVDPRTASGLPLPGFYKGVIVNVAVTAPTQAGWLTAYPSNVAVPNAANLNFLAGQTVPNLVQIGVGPDGTFKISNTDVPGMVRPPSGTVQIIVDIVGYYR